MSLRHELPSQRSQSSDPEWISSSKRPLSSSFFAAIDPTIPARHSSLHLYPQNVFPSKRNNLNCDLEIPYAFSHSHAAFYWTKDDALANHKLNIWAKPPCLNCEVVGESHAQRCDRHENQEETEGELQCCTKCKLKGDAWGCIEQVEIRADANYGRLVSYPPGREMFGDEEHKKSGNEEHEKSSDEEHATSPENQVFLGNGHDDTQAAAKKELTKFDFLPWCSEEQELRAKGVVWWQPINLACGDVGRKEQIVEQWMQQDSRRGFTPVRKGFSPVQMNGNNVSWRRLKVKAGSRWRAAAEEMTSSNGSWSSRQSENGILKERMSLAREINYELVVEWNKEEDDLKREAEEANEVESIRLRESAAKKSVLELERKKLSWSEEIRLERTRKYYQDIEEVGHEVADLSLDAWRGIEESIISQACRFLEQKHYWMKQGLSEEDAIDLSKKELTGNGGEEADCVNELEDLVPRIFEADVLTSFSYQG